MKKKILLALPILFIGAVTVYALSSGYNSPAHVSKAIFGSAGSCSSSAMTASEASGGCPYAQQAAMEGGCCAEKAAVQTASADSGCCAAKGSIQAAAYMEGSAAEFAMQTTEGECSMGSCSAEAKQVAANCDECPMAKEDCASCPMMSGKSVQTADAGEAAQIEETQE